MKTKIKKLLFEFSRNMRITTRELGRRIKTTQQSSSYLINQLRKKKTIQSTNTIVDNVKLGYTNVLVGLNYLNFESDSKKEILDYLKNMNSVTAIEEAKQGVDLLIEYTSLNLSAFNKDHSEFGKKFHKSIETRFVFPIIVKHKFLKNYLTKKPDDQDIILCGDRKTIDLSVPEKKTLTALVKNPDAKYVQLAKDTKLSVKSIVNLKKSLQKKGVIKGYSCILNNKKLEISRYFIFLRTKINTREKIVEYTKQNKNIVEITKLIGEFDLMLTIEELKETEILKDIRSNFHIEDYFIVRSENIVSKDYLPKNL